MYKGGLKGGILSDSKILKPKVEPYRKWPFGVNEFEETKKL